MKRSACVTCLVCLTLAATAGAQQSAALPGHGRGPSFEVASVKSHVESGERIGATFRTLPGGHFEARNITIPLLLARTHFLQLSQIVGGPGWMAQRRFDIVAKAPEGVEWSALPQMLDALLRERFSLVARIELRKQPVFLLVKARGNAPSPGLRLSKCAAVPSDRNGADTPPPCRSTGRMGSGTIILTDSGIASALKAHLTREAKQLVLDRTGLEGLYDVELRWSSGPDGPSLFTAIREQLGLELVPREEPIETLVVDHIQEPSPN